MRYELFYLVGQNNEEKLEAIKKEVDQTLTDEGATLGELEVITRRKLSYEVKHQSKGIYVAKRFEMPEVDYWADGADAEKIPAMESLTKKLNLNQNILRFLIVKADELPELKQKEDVPVKKDFDRREKRNPREKTDRKPRAERPQQKEAPKQEENIDKKLEEILNI